MDKEKRLIYFEKSPEGSKAEQSPNALGDYLKLQGLANNTGFSLNEKTDDDGDKSYEFVNDKGQVVMHIHIDAKTGKYTLVEHGDFGERLAAQAEKIDGLASDIDKLAKKKLA